MLDVIRRLKRRKFYLFREISSEYSAVPNIVFLLTASFALLNRYVYVAKDKGRRKKERS